MKLLAFIAVVLLAILVLLVNDQRESTISEREQADEVERNRAKRVAARSRGYDTENNFDPRDYNEAGERIAAAASAPQPPVHRVRRMQCVAIRGVVIGREEGAIVIDCNARPATNFNPQAWAMNGDPGMGRKAQQSLARLAMRDQQVQESRAYGELRVLRDGRFIKAEWNPTTGARGTLRLADSPALATGSAVNIIAAPVGGDRFTASFEVAEDAPGDWKWGSPTVLDQQTAPPRLPTAAERNAEILRKYGTR